MDNASKNAGEMINKFQILFNRTRQAVITGELVEIITGCVYHTIFAKKHYWQVLVCSAAASAES